MMHAVLNWWWQGSVVALALVVLLRPLARARANVRYVVCWAALLLVVALPGISLVLSTGAGPDVLAAVPVGAIVAVPDAWWTSSAVILAGWALWVAVHSVQFAGAIVALRRARAGSRPFPPEVESQLAHWRRVGRDGRRSGLVLSDSVTAAAVLGCGTPTIAVAPSLLTSLDADELDRVVIHEWAHVRRWDDLAHVLQIAIRAVAGWHPAVWWIDRQLHLEREVACDEMAVALTGSPAAYAACLVKLADARGVERTALAAPAVVRRTGLRARVTRIVARHAFIAPAWARSLAVGAVSVLGALALVVGGLRLVEPTALALPLESIPVVGTDRGGVAPIARSAQPGDLVPVGASPQAGVRVVSSRPPAESPVRPNVPVSLSMEHASTPDSPATADPVPVQAGAAVDVAATAVIVPSESAAGTAPPPTVKAEAERSPWTDVADGGVTLGRKSKDAGLATAGFFSRLSRRVAGSF